MIALRVTSPPLRGFRLLKSGSNVVQIASITGRSTRGEPLKLPKPFPYNEKRFGFLAQMFDNTMYKFSQENARIIVVEGPIGVGKTAVCKALAEEFDMLYMPQVTMDELYLLPSGYDLRQHDHELPDRVRSYDHKNFCVDPKNIKAGNFQMDMMYLRFYQYVDALTHLLNTGQGVILERSYYSDYVFMNAMREHKYVSKEVFKAYNMVKKNTSTFLMAPHLVLYLDIPVPVVQERIRTRNYSYEQNSPALTTEYLQSLEKFWKQDYLKLARENSEILVYDWTDGGDVEVVVDDIEKLDLDTMRHDKKFLDWWKSRGALRARRYQYTVQYRLYTDYFQYPYHSCSDLYIAPELQRERENMLSRIPECKYDMGFNPHMGDSIFKILFTHRRVNRRHRRYHLAYSAMNE